ncbi:MAG: hypothetical protein BGN96_12240 [Bacteroidales bacterium 45-6]|nr:MAG: hypothetical protein BGN96_12240 [Bacteroidales bacterium 45-6]
MRNYKLLDALEAYLLAEDEWIKNPSVDAKSIYIREKREKLERVIWLSSTTEDIKEMIQDLRDYWETLKSETKPEIKAKDVPIGDMISCIDRQYIICESNTNGCEGCDFIEEDDLCSGLICLPGYRSDKKNVIAKLVEKPIHTSSSCLDEEIDRMLDEQGF